MKLVEGLFVDVTHDLASPAKRDILGKSDPLIRGALVTILERGDFIKSLPNDKQEQSAGKSNQSRPLAGYQALNDYDPAIVSDLMERSQASIEELQQSIQTKSGPDLIDFIQEDIQQFWMPRFLTQPRDFADCLKYLSSEKALPKRENHPAKETG